MILSYSFCLVQFVHFYMIQLHKLQFKGNRKYFKLFCVFSGKSFRLQVHRIGAICHTLWHIIMPYSSFKIYFHLLLFSSICIISFVSFLTSHLLHPSPSCHHKLCEYNSQNGWKLFSICNFTIFIQNTLLSHPCCPLQTQFPFHFSVVFHDL